MTTCYSCDQTATWIFNDDKPACNDCHSERLDEPFADLIGRENILAWRIGTRP